MIDERTDHALAREFGERVRVLRRRRGWSQEQLADSTGMHRTFIGQVENGKSGPTLVTITRLALALAVDPADLVRGLKPTAADPIRRSKVKAAGKPANKADPHK